MKNILKYLQNVSLFEDEINKEPYHGWPTPAFVAD